MITYLKGDATQPRADDPGRVVICHIVNDVGAWGAGFTSAIDRRFGPHAGDVYRRWAQGRVVPDVPFTLGHILYTAAVAGDAGMHPKYPLICHMLAQHGVGVGRQRVDYAALGTCLARVAEHAAAYSLHMPRIGCGLGGGSWSDIEPIVAARLADLDVYIYDLEKP